jgi:hypothetical protein
LIRPTPIWDAWGCYCRARARPRRYTGHSQRTPFDADAAGNARLEAIDGTNRVSFLTVDRTNCIENHLLKALQYLQANYPTRGWGQFCSNNAVRWSMLIVCGHSQGGNLRLAKQGICLAQGSQSTSR